MDIISILPPFLAFFLRAILSLLSSNLPVVVLFQISITNVATIIYHGNESFITDPSDSLKQILTDYNVPEETTLTRRLFPNVGADDEEERHTRLLAEMPDAMYDASGRVVSHRQLLALVQKSAEEVDIYDANGRKLVIPAWVYYYAGRVVWRVVGKRVWTWVWSAARGWVQKQVMKYVQCVVVNGYEYCDDY